MDGIPESETVESARVGGFGQVKGLDARAGELRVRARTQFMDPYTWARELRVAYDRVLSGDADDRVPFEVRRSWQRALAAGVNPDGQRPPRLHEIREIRQLRSDHSLAPFIPALSDLLADTTGGHILVVASDRGEILWRIGSPDIIRRAERLEFAEGAHWAENAVGTNAIGSAIELRRAVQVFSAEHLVRSHHDWVCSAAPVCDPETGALLGVMDVSGPYRTANPDALALVRCGAALVHEMLRSARRSADDKASALALSGRGGRDNLALISPGGRLIIGQLPSPSPQALAAARRTGHLELPDGTELAAQPQGDYLLVQVPSSVAPLKCPCRIELCFLGGHEPSMSINGKKVLLSPRRAEILALLAIHSAGLSADEMAVQLYGDDGLRATARAEMHRIRSMLDDAVQSNPYRFARHVTVHADFIDVRNRVRNGDLSGALDAYQAPLFPRSSTMAIVLLRDELHETIRSAVLASPGSTYLRRWIDNGPGSLDVQAITLLRDRLPSDDHERAYLFARRRRLDREFGVDVSP